MAGRTADISTSSFKPLSLDEIMMVPLAKQKQEDQLLAGADKFNQLQADVLSQDSAEAERLISDYKSRASSLADEIISKGVDREQFHKLRGLKSELTNQQSTGFLGRATANKKAASQFVKELATKKERQAGWSPQQAQAWAQSQVANFKGTMDETGDFRSFSGQNMAMKVDEDEFITDAIDSVAEYISPESYKAVQIGGLPAFQKAFQSGDVSSKDYNRIMDAITTKAKTNPDLLASLKQQAFFTGEENPLDLGAFKYESYKDKATGKEKTKRVFVPGKSRFGQKAAGYGRASQYNNLKLNTKFLKDEIGLTLYKNGMEERKALDLIAFERGEMNEITPDSIENVQETLEFYGDEVSALKTQADNRKKSLIASGMTEQEALQDPGYMRMYNSYRDGNIKHQNMKARMDAVYSKVEGKLDPDTKAVLEFGEVLEQYKDNPIEALKEKFGIDVESEKYDEWASKGFGRSREVLAEKLLGEKMGVDMNRNGRGRMDIRVSSFMLETANDNRVDVTEEYLEANPQAEHFTIINAPATGKYSSKYGAWQELKNENFNVASANLAYGKGALQDSPEFLSLGESEKGFEYRVSPTDGWDDNGLHFNNVIITNKDTGIQASVQVVDTQSNEMLLDLSRDLQGGGFDQRKMGEQLEANVNYMPIIKKSGVLWQNEGSMLVPAADNSRREVKYTKNEDGYYSLTLEGVPLELNGRTELAGEKEIALALNQEIKGLNEYLLSLEENTEDE